ncbi:methyltransferase domain-containing protein [Polychytrium aggregatum]|uniref:methyltransferase domain-containing protein n=1 Tax=Polychytrium aggregatum TaxID=110093 RepID=UPI0022FDFDB8|nr:methyltransferase domain-containing protein [Polychytrium aggregatum]KAI9202077.1 methyltransferase domain-containing protein [Polychytrium aggregatum]
MILRILSRPAPLIIAAVVLLVVVLLNFELISLASRPPNAGISHDIPPVVFSSTDTAAKSLLDYVRQPVHGVCNHTKTFGGSSVVGSEGSWTICMDLLPPTTFPCVVYSFGINNDFSFDDQIHLKATDHGCEVHSFDPSMGVQSHERTPGHWFHDAGISAVDSDNWDGGLTSANHDNTKGWVVKTVPSWMNTLSHNKINLLKIDTEYAEWGALQNLLDTGYIRQVDQLVVEVHFWTSRKDKQRTDAQEMAWWMTTLLRLESAGFKLFYKHENPLSSVEGSEGAKYLCCHELGFVRQLPSFKVANRVEHVAADPEPAAKKIQRLVNLIEKPIAKDACASTDVFGGTPRGQGDGVWTICRDLLPKTSTKCIVYSFGINNDFSFDDQIGAGGVDGGCEVGCPLSSASHRIASHCYNFHCHRNGARSLLTYPMPPSPLHRFILLIPRWASTRISAPAATCSTTEALVRSTVTTGTAAS